jgi:O-antigen biosynthesis protein
MEFTGERMIPEFNQGQEIYLEHITRYMFASQFVSGKVVLDIACGSGYGSDYLSKAGAKKIIGVDISEETIEYCKKNYPDNGIEFLQGSVDKIPLADKSVDIIVSFETIEHVDEKAQLNFLKEVKRVLRPEGIFVVSTPNSLIYPKGNEFHLKELNPEEFNNVLKKNFKNVEMFYQDDVECSYVYSQENLENLNNSLGISKMADTIKAMDSMYLVAVCSGLSVGKITENIGLSKIKIHDVQNYWMGEIKKNELMIQQKDQEVNNLNQAIQQKDQAIQQKDQAIQQKDQAIQQKDEMIRQKGKEINTMKSSKFWKMRQKYMNLKGMLKL